MGSISILEWIGYAASVLVLISMLMSSFLKLRIVNLVGSGMFSVYGFMIGSFPVGLLNLFVVFANIWHLYKMFGVHDNFSALEIRRDNRYLVKFLDFYSKDINKYFPNFEYNNGVNTYSYMILRNMAVAGVFLAREVKDKVLYVGLDYVIPEYRDLKPGNFIYKEKVKYFEEQGYNTLVTIPTTDYHKKYLVKMGFKRGDIDGVEHYIFSFSN